MPDIAVQRLVQRPIQRSIQRGAAAGGTEVLTVIATNNDATWLTAATLWITTFKPGDSAFQTQNDPSGVRFVAIPIPQGSTIVSAVLELDLSNVAGIPGNMRVSGKDVDNTANNVLAESDPSGWSLTAGNTTFNYDAESPPVTKSIDVQAIVEDIITDRAGWASGNNMTFLIESLTNGLGEFLTFAEVSSVLTIVWTP